MLQPTFTYNAFIVKIVDADTVDLIVDLGLRVTMNMRVRIYGVNAPEMSTPEGRIARAALVEKLPLGSRVVVKTFKNPTDKYGRWLAAIEIDGQDISQWLILNNHAVVMNF